MVHGDLFERARERAVSSKTCGEGKYPKTFLPRAQAAKGKHL